MNAETGLPSAPRARRRGAALAFAVIAFAGWRVADNTVDNDLWGHVLYGQRMWALGGLERFESLSWTAAGEPWINHEVLAELTMGAVHRLAGATGLWALMMALAVGTIGWAWREGAGQATPQRIAAWALLALTANAIALGYAMRPQLFTYLCFVALLVGLRRLFQGGIAPALALPLLLAVWVNAHGGFLAGWAVLIAAVIVELLAAAAPRWAAALRCSPGLIHPLLPTGVALAGTMALLANPWGVELVTWTVATVRLPRPAIPEWAPMPLTAGSIPFFFTIALGLAAWAFSRAPRRAWEMAVWAMCALLAVRHQRHAPLFGLASLVFLPAHLADAASLLRPHVGALRAFVAARSGSVILRALLAAGGGAALAAAASREHPSCLVVPRDLYPVAAIEFMRDRGLTGRTVTFFDWGQQVMWMLPDNPVSFDGRLDTVYSPAVMDAHWRLYRGEDPGTGLDLSLAAVALLPARSGAVPRLQQQGWRVVYRDPLAAVLVPASSTAAPGRGIVGEAGSGVVPFPDTPAPLAGRLPSARP